MATRVLEPALFLPFLLSRSLSRQRSQTIFFDSYIHGLAMVKDIRQAYCRSFLCSTEEARGRYHVRHRSRESRESKRETWAIGSFIFSLLMSSKSLAFRESNNIVTKCSRCWYKERDSRILHVYSRSLIYRDETLLPAVVSLPFFLSIVFLLIPFILRSLDFRSRLLIPAPRKPSLRFPSLNSGTCVLYFPNKGTHCKFSSLDKHFNLPPIPFLAVTINHVYFLSFRALPMFPQTFVWSYLLTREVV